MENKIELSEGITLSKKNQKVCDRFPAFFIPMLNALEFLYSEFGYRKPQLDTSRGEAWLVYQKRDIRCVASCYYLHKSPVTVDVMIKVSVSRALCFHCQWDYLAGEDLQNLIRNIRVNVETEMRKRELL